MVSDINPRIADNNRIWPLLILVIFLIIHGATFTFGDSHPDAFMAGDRAGSRLQTIETVFLLNSDSKTDRSSVGQTLIDPSFWNRVIEAGYPGDYILQGILYSAGGASYVILFQLALSLLSVFVLFQFARLLNQPPSYAFLAVLLYLFLPGSLILPHQLAGEALYIPFIIIGFYLIVRYFEMGSPVMMLVGGLLFITLAIFVRQQLLLYPFLLIAIVILLHRNNAKRDVVAIAIICIALPMSWLFYSQSQTDGVSLGNKNVTVGSGFSKTAKRMAVVGDFTSGKHATIPHEMSTLEFAKFVLDHPASFVKLKSYEIGNLMLNSGSYSVAVHHFGLFSGAGDTDFWKSLRDRTDILSVLSEVSKRGPLLSLVVFGGTAIWGLLLLGSLFGAYFFLREPSIHIMSKAVLLSYLVYGLSIVLIASDVRWAHRAPVEFFLMILFVCCIRKRGQVLQPRATYSKPEATA